MSNNYLTPHDAFTAVLRASGISTGNGLLDFDWTNQPYYEEAPETMYQTLDGKLAPFVVFSINPSTVEWQFENTYIESYDIEVKVTATEDLIGKVSSPYYLPTKSIVAYLDTLNAPEILGSSLFQVIYFARQSYQIVKEDARGPDTARIWTAKANYKMQLSLNQPLPNRVP